LPLEKDEVINAILPVAEFTQDQFVFMVTSSGTCKKTSLKKSLLNIITLANYEIEWFFFNLF
jgi:DNA gyrase/topoisomerase IV subunit A